MKIETDIGVTGEDRRTAMRVELCNRINMALLAGNTRIRRGVYRVTIERLSERVQRSLEAIERLEGKVQP